MPRDDQKDKPAAPPPEPTGKKTGSKPAKPRENKNVVSADAKNLRDLIGKLSDKNTAHTGKDVEAVAKETLKMVAEAQKTGSEALKRESTKALLAIRNLIEKSEKINEVKRAKIMGDLEKVSLDAGNAAFLLLSIAKQQAKNIKEDAIREATAEKLKITQMKKDAALETKTKTDKLKAEAKAVVVKMKADAQASIDAKKSKLKQEKDDARVAHVDRMNRLHQQQADFKTNKDLQNQKIKQDRADAAVQIKRVKLELNDKHKQKQMDLKNSHDKMKDEQLLRNKARIQKLKDIKDNYEQRKFDNAQKNKSRIQQIRDMKAEAKIKLKKTQDDAKAEAVVKKLQIKDEYNKIKQEAKERQQKHEKNADALSGKVKDGIMDANPLIHAAVEIGSGIVGHIMKNRKDKKHDKAMNKLVHDPHTSAAPNNAPNATPADTPPANPGANTQSSGDDSGGGMFGNILKMIPSITSIISGIGSVFSGIVNFGKMAAGMIGGPGLAAIAIGAVVINGIFDFIDGFNNAGKLFGDKFDGSITEKLFSGFVNVGAMLWGLVDDIAHFLGFDTNFKKMYQDIALKIFDTVSSAFKIVSDTVSGIFDSVANAIRSFAGVVGNILSYIPGAGGAAKALQEFAKGGKGSMSPPDTQPAVTQIASKQGTVDDLKDKGIANAKKPNVAAMIDNSVKTSQTNLFPQKMDTRNNDPIHNRYGYGGSTVFGNR